MEEAQTCRYKYIVFDEIEPSTEMHVKNYAVLFVEIINVNEFPNFFDFWKTVKNDTQKSKLFGNFIH